MASDDPSLRADPSTHANPVVADANKDESSVEAARSAVEKQTPPPPPPSAAPPDGGLKAWLLVLAAWLLFAISWGPSLGYGVFQQYYESDLLRTHTPSKIAWIGSVQAFFLISAGVVVGPLFDRGYLLSVMVVGCLLTVLGQMMLSLSTQYYQVFCAQGLCLGLGAGVIYVPGVAMIGTRFAKKKAMAMSLAISGISIGGVIVPVVFRRLVNQIGFPWTCRVLGFISLAVSLFCLAILPLQPKKTTKPRKLIELDAFKEAPFMLINLSGFCSFLAYWIPLFYLPTFGLTALQMSPNLSYYMISILNAGSFVGRLAPAFIIPQLGAMPTSFISHFCCAVLLFGWIGVTSNAGFIVWSILFGMFSGIMIGTNPTACAHPTISPLRVYGTRWGIISSAAAVGTLVGTPIAGALAHPDMGKYVNAQAFAGTIMAVGLFFKAWPTVVYIRYERNAKERSGV